MKTCEVVGCGGEAKRENLCTVHALCWLLSSASDKTPGREDRHRAFVARASLWMQARTGVLAEGVT